MDLFLFWVFSSRTRLLRSIEFNLPHFYLFSGDSYGCECLSVWLYGYGYPAPRRAAVDSGRRVHRPLLHCVWQGSGPRGLCSCQVNREWMTLFYYTGSNGPLAIQKPLFCLKLLNLLQVEICDIDISKSTNAWSDRIHFQDLKLI